MFSKNGFLVNMVVIPLSFLFFFSFLFEKERTFVDELNIKKNVSFHHILFPNHYTDKQSYQP